MLGVVLIAAGALALACGGFTYTKDNRQVTIGPLELSIKDTRTVNIPLWTGVGPIAVSGLLLVMRR